jgi:hypothetical protein
VAKNSVKKSILDGTANSPQPKTHRYGGEGVEY